MITALSFVPVDDLNSHMDSLADSIHENLVPLLY